MTACTTCKQIRSNQFHLYNHRNIYTEFPANHKWFDTSPGRAMNLLHSSEVLKNCSRAEVVPAQYRVSVHKLSECTKKKSINKSDYFFSETAYYNNVPFNTKNAILK